MEKRIYRNSAWTETLQLWGKRYFILWNTATMGEKDIEIVHDLKHCNNGGKGYKNRCMKEFTTTIKQGCPIKTALFNLLCILIFIQNYFSPPFFKIKNTCEAIDFLITKIKIILFFKWCKLRVSNQSAKKQVCTWIEIPLSAGTTVVCT